jgi:hypothetical protein
MRRRHYSSPDPTSTRVQYTTRHSPVRGDDEVDAEARVLTTEAGSRLLAEIALVRSIRPSDIARLRQWAALEVVSAAIRLSEARIKATGKFEHGQQMWVEPISIEQATSEPVARHKAARFTAPLVVDLCAGIGGDTLALAAGSLVLAVDLDQGMCRRLRHNASVYQVADRILPVRSRAETFAIPAGAWLHIDPDRRTVKSRRARSLVDYAPGPEFWKSAASCVPAGAIKLGPASDFERHFGSSHHEIELISYRGECKEATVWFGELVSCHRRATRLPENVTWTDRDGPRSPCAPVSSLGNLIFNPDPGLVRAGLLDGFAQAHGLARLADGVDYLTGDRMLLSPFLQAFHVLDLSPLDHRQLKRLIKKSEIGTLEIKVRGLNVAPETLRRQLDLSGDRTATLLLIGGTGPARAVLAQRASTGGSITSSAGGAAGACDSASGAAPLPLSSD